MSNLSIVAEAESGLDAILAVKLNKPSLLILDAAMPKANGIEVLIDSRRWSPHTRVVLLTGFTAPGILREWVEVGVEGMLLKSCAPDEMRGAFSTVLGGGTYISPKIKAILDETPKAIELSHREREVLSMLASGFQNRTIAERLSISVRTVEKHRASLMFKLDVTSLAELMIYAMKEGLLDGHKQL